MVKYVLKTIMTFLFILSLFSVSCFAYTGNGTQSEPYIIAGYEDFCSVAEDINNGKISPSSHIKLASSIDFYDKDFTPIGTSDIPFAGAFDGDGYCLNNITYSTVDTACGVIAYAQNAVIKNLGVISAQFVSGSRGSNVYCGLICGSFVKTDKNSDTDIEKCHATGSITVVSMNADKAYAGGIVGKLASSVSSADLTVRNCYSDCDITVRAKEAYCGGFAGYAGSEKSATTVEIGYLYTKGTLNAIASEKNAYCGGMVGYLKAEESGWGEWMSDDAILFADDSYALFRSISLCEVSAQSTSGKAYSSYTASQTESGPQSYRLYCTGTDNNTGGIRGSTVSASVVSSSSFMGTTLGFDLKNVWTLNGGLGLVRKQAASGSVYGDGKSVHVSTNGGVDGRVIVAAYDRDGRMLDVKIRTVSGADDEVSISFGEAPVTVGILTIENNKFLPICTNAYAS